MISNSKGAKPSLTLIIINPFVFVNIDIMKKILDNYFYDIVALLLVAKSAKEKKLGILEISLLVLIPLHIILSIIPKNED